MNPDPRTDAPLAVAQRIQPAPDPLADESTALLAGALAQAWPQAPAPAGLRDRLVRRAAHSARRIAAMVNVRQRDRELVESAAGLTVQRIYLRDDASPVRPGEPQQVRLAQLQPGALWHLAAGPAELGREWLLVQGSAELSTLADGSAGTSAQGASGDEGRERLHLAPLDYHVQSGAASRRPARLCAGEQGALVMLRERAWPPHGPAAASVTARESPAAWDDYAPLVRRRVLWRDGPMAAMLWLAEPGASVPHHEHGHDEECLMLRGDLFQDDYLLQEGDYQLAPSGSAHETVTTDTGALIYAHGDLDMRFV